jgi:hypothetical protein
MKLSGDGLPVWSSYLGGESSDYGNGIALDGTGNIYIAGYTFSAGWITGGYQTTLNQNAYAKEDGFVAKLTNDGQFVWSTYIGGENVE